MRYWLTREVLGASSRNAGGAWLESIPAMCGMPLAIEMAAEIGAIEALNLRTVEAGQAALAGTGNRAEAWARSATTRGVV